MRPRPGRGFRRAGADAVRTARPAQIKVHRPPASTRSRSPWRVPVSQASIATDQPTAPSGARDAGHVAARFSGIQQPLLRPDAMLSGGLPRSCARSSSILWRVLSECGSGRASPRSCAAPPPAAPARRRSGPARTGRRNDGAPARGSAECPGPRPASCPSGNAPSPACSSLRRTPAPARPCDRTPAALRSADRASQRCLAASTGSGRHRPPPARPARSAARPRASAGLGVCRRSNRPSRRGSSWSAIAGPLDQRSEARPGSSRPPPPADDVETWLVPDMSCAASIVCCASEGAKTGPDHMLLGGDQGLARSLGVRTSSGHAGLSGSTLLPLAQLHRRHAQLDLVEHGIPLRAVHGNACPEQPRQSVLGQ